MRNATPEEIATRHQTMFENQASFIGITTDQFKAEWAQGKNLQEIAQAHGISETDLQARMSAERKEHQKTMLQALVNKGVITQAQADQRLQVMESRISEGKGFGWGMGGGMGMGFKR